MKNLKFDPQMETSDRPLTVASGYMQRMKLCDGKTWVTDKVLHSDMVRTEYRIRYNGPKPFQKSILMNSTGRLPKMKLTYDKH